MAVVLKSASYNGVEGQIIEVEVDIARGLPCFNIVGDGDTSVREAKERVRTAIVNSGFEFPLGRVTVNLAPADIRKEGGLFDLPIALGILIESNQIEGKGLEEYIIFGELSLNGDLKGVRGALPVAIEGVKSGFDKIIIPHQNRKEIGVFEKLKVHPYKNIKELIDSLRNGKLEDYTYQDSNKVHKYQLDFSDVIGHESSKRVLEIAAAGGHNVLMFGSPGSGKSMLASRVPTILPNLSFEEALEVTQVYSVAGELKGEGELIKERPFRAPHQSITKAGLIGGGNKVMPGELSLAHNGVLFLDEVLEFKKELLDLLRQPLETGKITITRKSGSVEYPANVILLCACNLCPCGYYGSKNSEKCTCSEWEIKMYLKRLSGPLLDRFDLFVRVNSIDYDEIKSKKKQEGSGEIKGRVIKARENQEIRFKEKEYCSNANMSTADLSEYCELDKEGEALIKSVYKRYSLSTRAYNRILKVSRTIADIEGREKIEKQDIIEAINYRRYLEDKII